MPVEAQIITGQTVVTIPEIIGHLRSALRVAELSSPLEIFLKSTTQIGRLEGLRLVVQESEGFQSLSAWGFIDLSNPKRKNAPDSSLISFSEAFNRLRRNIAEHSLYTTAVSLRFDTAGKEFSEADLKWQELFAELTEDDAPPVYNQAFQFVRG